MLLFKQSDRTVGDRPKANCGKWNEIHKIDAETPLWLVVIAAFNNIQHRSIQHRNIQYRDGHVGHGASHVTVLKPSPRRYQAVKRTAAGFTLLESLTVVAMIGILAAIAAASWLSFLNTWRLNTAQDQVYQVMIMARSTAKQKHRRWQASFRSSQTQVEWAVHSVNADMGELTWNALPGMVQIDPDESTLYQSSDDIYRVQFDHNGNANGRLGRLTLAGVNPHKARRCVVVSTLIGTLRKARDRPTPQNGRNCY